MKIVLEKKDIKIIKLEDFTFKEAEGYTAGMIFNVDDEYELTDEEDQIIIEISGTYYCEGIHVDANGWGRGRFSGKLIIYKDDCLFGELEEHKIFADFIELNCSVGGSSSIFEVDTSSTLSENIHNLISLEHNTYLNYVDSVFSWGEVLDNEDLLDKLKPELKKIIPDLKDDKLPDTVDDLYNLFENKGIIYVDYYGNPEFNAKYDNTLGKLIFPYFKKEFDNYAIEDEDEDEDGGFSISGKPGEEDKDAGIDINCACIYLK